MTFEEKTNRIQVLDRVIADLTLARDGYRRALDTLKRSADLPPSAALQDFMVSHLPEVLHTATTLDQLLVAMRMERVKLDMGQEQHLPFVAGVLS